MNLKKKINSVRHFSRTTGSLLLICVLTVSLAVTGCAQQTSASGEYHLYYKNSAGTKLVTMDYSLQTQDETAQVTELLSAMNVSRKQDDLYVAKPENVVIESIDVSSNIVSVYFTESYTAMDSATEVLYRASVVKTLTQLPQIESVMFFINGTSATYSNGSTIGMMRASDFVDGADDAETLQWTNLQLYFANSKGNMLVGDTMTVGYSKTVPIERMIIEQLIQGSKIAGCYRTLPENLKLLNVSVNDGVCYVNFDAAFTTEIVNVSDAIPIYSVVNSLCELSYINSVQILINGDTRVKFRDSISLQQQFEPDESLITE